MGLYTVEVAVALTSPPRAERFLWYRLIADNGLDAELLACRWAGQRRGVLTAVSAVVLDWDDEP